MVISLALLGYAASGTVLTLWRRHWMRRFEVLFPTCLGLFALSAPGCWALAQRVNVHPEELLWSPRQVAWVLALYLLLAVPFFFIGAAVGSALMRFPASGVYAADLIGAGTGTVLVVALLWALTPGDVLRLLATLALAAVVHVPRFRLPIGVVVVAVVLVWLMPAAWIEPRPSEYKGLSQALRVQGTELVEERSSPLALVSVVETPDVPLRHAPGLSLALPVEPPEQVALFLDAEALTPVLRWRDGSQRLAFLDYSTQALPYAVINPKRVLVLGAGGGEEVARARYAGVESVTAVEINPDVVDVVRDRYAAFSGDLYERPSVEVVVADARGFASRDPRTYDLVVLPTVSGYGGGGPALASLSEDYLLTVEAFDVWLERLVDGGLLSATVFLDNPPRDLIKLAATAITALERRGVAEPGVSLAVIRSWQTATLVVKNGGLTAAEIARLRRFAEQRRFDIVHVAGMDRHEVNRYNRLPEAAGALLPHQAIVELLGAGRQDLYERYQFAIRPATDDRPFFHQFFRWRSLEQIAASRDRGGLSMLEAGYLVLVVTLVVALASALILVLAPLAVLLRSGRRERRGRVVVYFAALGLGFLLLEVAFLQQLILVLHHPVYSAAVVIATFLLAAGAGSALAPTVARRWGERTIARLVAGIVALGILDLILLATVAPSVSAAAAPMRVAFAVALVAPLAFLMGMPFPLGLGMLKESAQEMVPWAWAINGCASVVSPILATIVAVHWGFRVVVLLALLAYAGAAAAGLQRNRAVPGHVGPIRGSAKA